MTSPILPILTILAGILLVGGGMLWLSASPRNEPPKPTEEQLVIARSLGAASADKVFQATILGGSKEPPQNPYSEEEQTDEALAWITAYNFRWDEIKKERTIRNHQAKSGFTGMVFDPRSATSTGINIIHALPENTYYPVWFEIQNNSVAACSLNANSEWIIGGKVATDEAAGKAIRESFREHFGK